MTEPKEIAEIRARWEPRKTLSSKTLSSFSDPEHFYRANVWADMSVLLASLDALRERHQWADERRLRAEHEAIALRAECKELREIGHK